MALKSAFLVFIGGAFVLVAAAILGGVRVVAVRPVSLIAAPGTLVVFNARELNYIDSPMAMCRRQAFSAEDCEERVVRKLSRSILIRFPYSSWLHDFSIPPSQKVMLGDATLRS